MSDEKFPRAIYGDPKKPLVIGNVEIPCYVLDNGMRVLSGRGMQTAMKLGQSHGAKLKEFLDKNSLKPFINNDLAMALENPIKFTRPGRGGITALGYEAKILVDICNAVLSARENGVLKGKQLEVAQQCEILTRALAKVGIDALVDEVTGYQEIRDKQALQKILEKYISEELLPWAKQFPDEFYELMFKLKGWQYKPLSVKRPGVVGRYTNDLIYARLAPGVLDELRRVTPRDDKGRTRHRYHQRLTEDIGHPKLKEHISNIITLMKAAPNWSGFYRMVQRALPKYGENLSLFKEDIEEDE